MPSLEEELLSEVIRLHGSWGNIECETCSLIRRAQSALGVKRDSHDDMLHDRLWAGYRATTNVT